VHHSAMQSRYKGREGNFPVSSTVFNLAADGSKIDREPLCHCHCCLYHCHCCWLLRAWCTDARTVFHSSLHNWAKHREENLPGCVTTIDLAVDGSKIDGLPSIMVVAVVSSSLHWVVYTVLCIAKGTACYINQGGGVGAECTPNLQYLNVLRSQRKGFEAVGTGGASAHGQGGHHGGW